MNIDIKSADERWHVVGRWLEYEGELRVALLRVVLVAVFYAAQLWHFLAFSDRSLAEQVFHRQATYLAAAWLFVSLAVLVTLTRHWLPRWLKFLTVSIDLALLTLIAALGSGPASPLVFVYWVCIALAGLRGNLALVWFGTLTAMAAYMLLVAMRDPVWFDAEHTTPPIEQIVALLSLASAGAIAGQLLRMLRQVTGEVFAGRSIAEERSQ